MGYVTFPRHRDRCGRRVMRSPPPPPQDPGSGGGPGVAELKPVRGFIPDSWKNFFTGKCHNGSEWDSTASDIKYILDGVRCSPPASPASSWRLGSLVGVLPGKTYSSTVDVYCLCYAYMKSWARLLRVLGVAELLLGTAVFSCVSAYMHKDNKWYKMFSYVQPYGLAASDSAYGSYSYSGPKMPFLLVVTGGAWVVTVVLLMLGMLLYYRTILLDSWWPLTEFSINVALFFLYMAAAIVYVNDANRGGACYYLLFKMSINASFCRMEGGQMAAIILFVAVVVYLISAMVALKLWRHEVARRHRELMEQEVRCKLAPQIQCFDSVDRPREEITYRQLTSVDVKPEQLNGHIPAGHIPKPIVMPDYLAKYPAIQTNEIETYKVVFSDQFTDYKELSGEVYAVLKKFDELDALLRKLPHNPGNLHEQERISRVLQEYKKKKNDPTFLEKNEHCEYLKNKLSHIKQRIQDYDKIMNWNVQV
ncbi:LOW QUALITY PROTEIN: MARVEL domain-containing protein 2-like [Eudromia elegans]